MKEEGNKDHGLLSVFAEMTEENFNRLISSLEDSNSLLDSLIFEGGDEDGQIQQQIDENVKIIKQIKGD